MTDSANVQIVQQIYEAFGRGDVPTILNKLAEDVEWHFVGKPEDVPFAGNYKGHQQIIGFFTTVGQTSEVIEFGPREIMAADDKVCVLGHEKVRVRATGRIFETDWIHLFSIQGGKVVRLYEFYDTATLAVAFRGG